MDASKSSRSHSSKRDYEQKIDARDSRNECNDHCEHAEKGQPRPSKLQKHSDEEIEDKDSGKRRKSSSSSSADSIERGMRSKIQRKNPDELRSSEGYRDRDYDHRRTNREDEHERKSSRNTSVRHLVHERSQSRSRAKAESCHGGKHEKMRDRDSRNSERKENSSREKGHGKEEGNHLSGRLVEADPSKKFGESSYVDKHDNYKHRAVKDRKLDPRYESTEAKKMVVDSSSEKDVTSINREERRAMDSRSEKDGISGYRDEKKVNGERSRNLGRLEAMDEHYRLVAQPREARLDTVRDDRQRKAQERSLRLMDAAEPSAQCNSKSPGDKEDRVRQQGGSAYGSRDEVGSREKSVNMDDNEHTRMRDKSGREVVHSKQSRTPERSGWHHGKLDEHARGDFSEYDNERSTCIKSKECEENYRDESYSKGKDCAWNGKNREWEGSMDHRRAIQSRQDTKEADRELDFVKEGDSQRGEQERVDSEKLHSCPGYRRDARIRPEGVKASSSFRNINEKSDSIEIKPNKNFDLGREGSVSTFHERRSVVESQQDFASGMNEQERRYRLEGQDKLANDYENGFGERFKDDSSPMDQNSERNSFHSQAWKGREQKQPMNCNHAGSGQSTGSGSQPPFANNQGSGSFNRALHEGPNGGQPGRGRKMTGRDSQRGGTPMPLMPHPFSPLGLTSGPLQPIGANMSHSPIHPIAPGLFMPPFPSPFVWPGAQGVDMSMLTLPPNLPPILPPGSAAPRFAPNIGSVPTHPMYFNQPGPRRGTPYAAGPGFNSMGSVGRETPDDKTSNGWGVPRNSGPSGKAPSRGEQNDYSQNFVDTGLRPQNFIRELELTSTVEDYPKLRELIQRKDEIVTNSASPPMYYKCDLHDFELTSDFFGTKFDVILVDPPWEEYVHRAPGVADHQEYWSFEEIQNLKIEAIADTPSFIFLWVGDGVGLEQGRQCLKKWGFRRCEDICWVKTNKRNATPGLRHDSRTLFQHSKEHCLMGIKGTVRRSTDGHIIHANIDTDIIIAEEPGDGSTKKPEDMYRIIEHFSLGRRRLELFGEDHNIRSGWLTLGKGLSASNFSTEAYIRNFADEDGKIWQGGSGRNPPPEAPHLMLTTPEIESLRPKSPPSKNQ